MPVKIIDHVYAQYLLTQLRNRNTKGIDFRKGLVRLGRIVGYELVRYFPTREVEVETPLGKAVGIEILGLDKVIIVQILRAAMPFVEGLLKAFPQARLGVIAARRKEEGGVVDVEVFYSKIPTVEREDIVIVADPMLATGITMTRAIEEVYRVGQPGRLIVVSVIATPVGIERVLSKYPETEIFVVAIDPTLNDKAFIVPGLGDAGDRAFST
ncbi:uracil phosphoribosyltransferase [Pyrobaculum islandicum DSM 4184]|uniref:Uracil phosphoribosyltransferase n=1 Tax=Pyrobaculum islandicum (strain DSM 4184 / JCM 9189 / GEO3) TaxID=384616 RepID=UPP_PYRIL|nr:uracil phosphoribosyltransferase [Pyrobaculum islandicum]A1RV13.1 RecName: Full=Uracil phosphoribosyltransferase; AltName: Full=UMP pyrophosphorylase; AltName: Full=UPRTase [Pyrobaculum islandicum DSM 4184]ABL88795.1 uracil phosphoribosyltransferase [Pyrobaculum islandicum DSM 4184]